MGEEGGGSVEGRTFASPGQLRIGDGDGGLVRKHTLRSPDLHLKIIFK